MFLFHKNPKAFKISKFKFDKSDMRDTAGEVRTNS